MATLAVSQGVSGKIRDINNDNKKDSEQSALATFAWRSVTDFKNGNSATLTEAEAVVSICALSTNNQADDQNLQLQNIQTLDFQDSTAFGANAANNASINRQTEEKSIRLASGKTLTTTWDPLCFDLKPKGTRTSLTDVDPQRPGTQAHIYIDTRASNLKKSEVNSYIKFVSQTSIEHAQKNGQPLSDLDGNRITREGWYDFTQRRGDDNKLTGDGANLIFNRHGILQGIKLTLTDNRFGDNNPAAMKISDPGALTFQEEEIPDSSQTATFSHEQKTTGNISLSEYIEPSAIKPKQTNFGLQANTIAPNSIFNASNRFERANYNSLIDSYGGAGSSPKILYNTAEARSIEAEEGGVKIIDLNQYPYNKTASKLTPKAQQRVGVVLTKRPSSAVTVEVSLSENPNLKVLTPTLTFTPENWNTPQEIRLKGCISPDASLTLKAKANAQGGFKGTEQDEVTVVFRKQRICGFEPKDSMTTVKNEPSWSTSFSESSLIEFQSPFFMILRVVLQPFFFALGMAKALNNTISPEHQEQKASAKTAQTDNVANKFAPNTFIDANPLTTISTPIIEQETSANNGITETILLGTEPVTAC